MKHTQGPWSALKYPDTRTWTVASRESIASKIKTEFDARLIAAAPDLLDIAKWMYERLTSFQMVALWESPEEHALEMEIYRKVIAKAEGKE